MPSGYFNRWSEVRPGGEPIHVGRATWAQGNGFGLHHHDFCEVTWCESGGGTHVINGKPIPIQPGDAFCLREQDSHQLKADDRGATMVNIAFSPKAVAALAKRHRQWPWRPGELPTQARLSAENLARLRQWTDELAHGDSELLDLEAFLLDLTRMLTRTKQEDAGMPDWLRQALIIFSEPKNLLGGTLRLAHLCGRSPAHINRVVQACQKRTATDLVNELRLNWAAQQLRLSDRSILEIALGCGLDHLGHFYRLFQGKFGTTPRRYRVQARRTVGVG